MNRLTFERRKEILKKVNPELELIDEFVGKDGKYWCTYKCSCGNITTKSWNGLQRGIKCNECSRNKTLTFEEKLVLLKERNPEVILLSEKRCGNNRVYCEYKTTFNETIRIREWSLLINETRTFKEPKIKKQIALDKLFKERQEILKEKHSDLELIEQVYKKRQSSTYYKYKCRCGNISVSTWHYISNGKNCIKCKGTNLMSIEEKQKVLDENGVNTKIKSQTIGKNGRSICTFNCVICGKEWAKRWNEVRFNGICNDCDPHRKRTLLEKQQIIDIRNPGIIIIDEFKKDAEWWVTFKCTCGRIAIKRWDHIQRGEHCMYCSQSRGENKITKFLIKNNINFIHQKQFDDLHGLSGRRKLVYDFYLLEHNILIEYDGHFHFNVINISHSKDKNEANFKRQVLHDRMKNEYAEDHSIKLIRIPYTEYDNIEAIIQKELILQ